MNRKLVPSLILLAMLLSLIAGDSAFAQEPVRGSGAKPVSKIDSGLASIAGIQDTSSPVTANQGLSTNLPYLPMSGDYVAIDAVASESGDALLPDLQAMGLQNGASYGLMVSGKLPVSAINAITTLDSLQFARPAYRIPSTGSVNSEGDAAMNANDARSTFGVDGSGITIGVISDSYDCLGEATGDVSDNELPSGIVVLQDDCTNGSDEGRAMMQIIHDVAPGAAQMFHTAEGGQAALAQGIRDLADAGSDVIVDDVAYLAEPMFQDGVVAQAVDDVVTNDGVAYFSSAGNSGRSSYEAPYVPGDTFFGGSVAHDFGGGDFYQRINIPTGTGFLMSFQWDSPFFSVSGSPGTTNDMDIYLWNAPMDEGGTVVASAISDNINGSGDAVELMGFLNFSSDTEFELMITKFAGSDPGTIKYILFPFGAVTIPGVAGSTVFGHTNAANAESVGASFHGTPTALESFSSYGPTPILFDTDGDPIPGGEIRNKPNIVGPDGVSTSVSGFSTFFGTSAAAPHAAAVAALMLEALPGLEPDELYDFLHSTATDMDDPTTVGFDTGFDFGTGHGFIQADAAVQAVIPFLTLTKQDSPDPILLGESLTYTLHVTNSGTDTAANVVITDTLPGNADFVSASTDTGSFSQSGDTVTFNLGSLASGQVASSTVTVIPTVLGTLTNNASVSSDTPTTGLVHDTASATTQVNPALSLDKQESNDSPKIGETLTYTLLTTNLSNATTTNVTVTDTLPVDVNFLSATSTAGSISQSEQTVTFSLGDLGQGQVASSTITVMPTVLGSITNSATVSSNNPIPGLVHDTDTAHTRVGPALVRSNHNPIGSAILGEPITYTLTVNNVSNTTSTNAKIIDTLSIDVIFVSASSTVGSIDYSGNIVTFNLGDMAAGDSAIGEITVVPSSLGTLKPGTITNYVIMTSDNPVADTIHSTSTEETTINPAVTITQSASQSALTVGDSITYSLQIDAVGTATSTNVTVVDTITPADIGSISATSTDAIIIQSDNEITLRFGDLSPGKTVTASVTILTAKSDTIDSLAIIYTDDPLPNTLNDINLVANEVNPVVVVQPSSSSSSGGGGGGGGPARRLPREIVPSTDAMVFTAKQDGRTPDKQFLRIQNGGSFILRWRVSSSEDWLKLRPTSGEADSSDLVGRVEVSVDISDLEVGTYVGKIIITAESDTTVNSPLEVEVVLEITSPRPRLTSQDVERLSPQDAAKFLSELDDQQRTEFFEDLQVVELDQIIRSMDEEDVVTPLANLSLSKFSQIPTETRLASLESVFAEQLTDEVKPEVDESLPTVQARGENATSASYLVRQTSDSAWTPLVASPEPIEGILGKFNKQLSDVVVDVQSLQSLPPLVPSLPNGQMVNSIFRIDIEGAQPSDIEAAHITFTVEKSWLIANDIHKWSIQLHRFDEERNQWVAFQSKRIAEDSDSITYTAVTPGFSLFALTGSAELSAPSLKVTNLQFVPPMPVENQQFAVRVSVQNIGTSEAVIPVSLWVDNTIEQSTTVALGEKETTTVSFALRRPQGTYDLRIDRLLGQVTVRAIENVFVLGSDTPTPAPQSQAVVPTATNTPTPVPTPTLRATATPSPVLSTPTPRPVIVAQAATSTPRPTLTPVPTVEIERITRASVPLPSPAPTVIPAQENEVADSDEGNPSRVLVFLLILMAVGLAGGIATFSRYVVDRRRAHRPPEH